jgi:hypothetical protein
MSDAKCKTCGRLDYGARIQVAPPITDAETDGACFSSGGLDCVRVALAARDAELARLKAAVPADVAPLIALCRQTASGTCQAAADALEALALSMAHCHERELALARRVDDLEAENAGLRAVVRSASVVAADGPLTYMSEFQKLRTALAKLDAGQGRTGGGT